MIEIAITGLRVPPYTPAEEGPEAFHAHLKKIAREWAEEPIELHPILLTLQLPNGQKVLAEVRYREGKLFVTLPALIEAIVPKPATAS